MEIKLDLSSLDSITVGELLRRLLVLLTEEPPSAQPPQKPPSGAADKPPHLIPVSEWKQHHDWPTEGSLRWLIFNSANNGFDKVIHRVGRRVLIDEGAFFEYVRQRKLGEDGREGRKRRAS